MYQQCSLPSSPSPYTTISTAIAYVKFDLHGTMDIVYYIIIVTMYFLISPLSLILDKV